MTIYERHNDIKIEKLRANLTTRELANLLSCRLKRAYKPNTLASKICGFTTLTDVEKRAILDICREQIKKQESD